MRVAILLLLVIVTIVLTTGCTSTLPSGNDSVVSTTLPIVISGTTGLANASPESSVIAGTHAIPMSETTTLPTPVATNSIPYSTSTPASDYTSGGSLSKTYYYVIDSTPGFIPFEVYTRVNEYILEKGNIYTGDNYTAIVDEPVQREYILPIVKNIRKAAKNEDDEARIAISLVQHIKYDANIIGEVQFNESRSGELYIGRYPYTILFQNWGGICGEKSFLLALILKELGYGVALFQFDDVRHMAVGIQASSEYAFNNTGYALIESTAVEIPTFDDYGFNGLDVTMSSLSPTKVIVVSEGKSFETIGKEAADADNERSVVSAMRNVYQAAVKLKATENRLDYLSRVVAYWKSKVEYDLTTKNSQYTYDYEAYQKAVADYNDYYDKTYIPTYVSWRDLNVDYEENYLPKQTSLEKKYGMTTGVNVGL